MKLSSLLPNPMQVICVKGPFKPEVIKEAAAEQLPVKEYARMLWDTVTAGNDESKKWDMDLMVKEYGLDQTSIDEINTELDVMKARLTSISLAPTPSLDERIEKRGSDYVVKPSKGDKVLGTHETKKAALKQVAAIEISKKSEHKQ